MKLHRSISTVVGKKYQSHDSREFPEYCRGMNVNNLITVCSEDSGLSLRTVITVARRKQHHCQKGVNRENLVNVNIMHERNTTETCVCVLNAQCCKNKAFEIRDFITDNHIDACSVTETWGEAQKLPRRSMASSSKFSAGQLSQSRIFLPRPSRSS